MAKKEKPPKKEKTPKEKKPKKVREKKEKVPKTNEVKKQSLLSKSDTDQEGEAAPPKKGKKKLLIIGGAALLVLLLAAGGAFFLIQSGILGSLFGSGSEEVAIDKPQIYTDGLSYYQAGNYYDAKTAFGYIEGYQDSKEMAEKIDLDSVYSGDGAKISEYIGSDVVNNYLLSYGFFSEITTALTGSSGSDTGSSETASSSEKSSSSEEGSSTSESSHSSESASAGENSQSTESESSGKSEEKAEKIEYDDSVKETVKEKTDAIIAAGSPVAYLELGEGNILYSANESLRKSAEFSVEAAKKIQEGVKNGTYKPGGTSETDTEIQTLLDNMKSENDIFLSTIDTIIGENGLSMLTYKNAGNCMKRYSETMVVFY